MNARAGVTVMANLSQTNIKPTRTPFIKWQTLLAVLFFECYVAVGAAIWQAIDQPTRSNDFAQPELNYLSCFYFMLVTFATVGFGDIVCTSNRSRAFHFCWGTIGVGFMGVVLVAVVSNISNFCSYHIRKLRKRYLRRRRAQENNQEGEMRPATPREKQKEAAEVEAFGETALGLQLAASTAVYLIYLCIGAGILQAIEDTLGNLPDDVTPNTFGNYFYFWWVASASIGYGTDYNPKRDRARMFFIVYLQIGQLCHVWLFSNVATSLMKFIGRVFNQTIQKPSKTDTASTMAEVHETV
eukprot:TRINITY_DN6979_c0_g1_i1.p1 TRINITY_DN6979_c0_g1~~TRINITY_DN6979_c0_g1_i1.p1  ORF type:complete len:298 (+),score=54.75 TRINITY_DN6979_c0_g1_i1:98-991(+)